MTHSPGLQLALHGTPALASGALPVKAIALESALSASIISAAFDHFRQQPRQQVKVLVLTTDCRTGAPAFDELVHTFQTGILPDQIKQHCLASLLSPGISRVLHQHGDNSRVGTDFHCMFEKFTQGFPVIQNFVAVGNMTRNLT